MPRTCEPSSADVFVIAALGSFHVPLEMLSNRFGHFVLFGSVVAIVCACGASVTNVGGLGEDGGSTVPPATDGDGGVDDPDSAAVARDGSIDAHEDADAGHADGGCVAACGARVCGRNDCADLCGTCGGGTAGCFMGACSATCPGTPCNDVDGHHICEGERGARHCTGGVKNLQVCTCSGGGANAWINCGACL